MLNEQDLFKIFANENDNHKVIETIQNTYNLTLTLDYVRSQRRRFNYIVNKYKKTKSKIKVAELEGVK